LVPRSPRYRSRPHESEQRLGFVEREPHDVLFAGRGVGFRCYSEKLLAGTRQRLSGFSQPRQCGDDVLRISTASAQALLDRMLDKVDALCADRDRLKKEQPMASRGKALGGRIW
jgi:hypothetical protein